MSDNFDVNSHIRKINQIYKQGSKWTFRVHETRFKFKFSELICAYAYIGLRAVCRYIRLTYNKKIALKISK